MSSNFRLIEFSNPQYQAVACSEIGGVAHAFLKEHDGDYVASRTVTFRILSAIVEGWRAADIATLLIETSADFDVSTVGIEVALMRLVDERVEFWNIGGLAVLARKTSGGWFRPVRGHSLLEVHGWVGRRYGAVKMLGRDPGEIEFATHPRAELAEVVIAASQRVAEELLLVGSEDSQIHVDDRMLNWLNG